MIDSDKRYFGSWWLWTLFLICITVVVLWLLGSVGLIGHTVVERKVFENSQQYTEARKTEILTFEAQLTEINQRLMSTTLSQEQKDNLEAQAAAIRVQLNVARNK